MTLGLAGRRRPPLGLGTLWPVLLQLANGCQLPCPCASCAVWVSASTPSAAAGSRDGKKVGGAALQIQTSLRRLLVCLRDRVRKTWD